MINYNTFPDVLTAAAEVASKLRINKEQATTECDKQGFILVGISKSNKTLKAQFILRDKTCEVKILNRKRGTFVKLGVPEEMLHRT